MKLLLKKKSPALPTSAVIRPPEKRREKETFHPSLSTRTISGHVAPTWPPPLSARYCKRGGQKPQSDQTGLSEKGGSGETRPGGQIRGER